MSSAVLEKSGPEFSVVGDKCGPVGHLKVELPTFDLSYVEKQLSDDLPCSDWASGRLGMAVEEYKRFLALCRAFPQKAIGISCDADKVWHRHILNTRRYIADCSEYFGYFLHHTPESETDENAEAQRETNALWVEFFEEPRKLHAQATCIAGGCMNNG